MSSTRRGREVFIATPFAAFFPSEIFRDYSDFTAVGGSVLKEERRTRVVSFSRLAGDHEVKFVLKVYRRHYLASLLTASRNSVARREFENLRSCRDLGVSAVEPVGFGKFQRFPGVVTSCFLITRLCENTVDFRQWIRSNKAHLRDDLPIMRALLTRLGSLMRKLHEDTFFLHTPNLRNILIRIDENGNPELTLLDIPFARFLSKRSKTARRAQARDLGAVFGPLLRRGIPRAMETFFETYLPDPLAGDEALLRRRAHHAARVHNNATLPSRFRKRAHRFWMRLVARLPWVTTSWGSGGIRH